MGQGKVAQKQEKTPCSKHGAKVYHHRLKLNGYLLSSI